MTDWVRLWHDMPTDPKWRVIARKSGQPLPSVIAVFNLMMINASGNASERGTLLSWDDEDCGAALDIDGADVRAIREAMQGKVLDGDRLSGWDKRQPKREDGTAAQRKAAWKARQETARNASERDGTHRNAPETETETETEKNITLTDVSVCATAVPDLLGDVPAEPCPARTSPARKRTAKPKLELVEPTAPTEEVYTPAELTDDWNAMAQHIGRPQIRLPLTPERAAAVRSRLAQFKPPDFALVWRNIVESPFLRGDTDRWAGVTFDWVLKKANFVKILEGNYNGETVRTIRAGYDH